MSRYSDNKDGFLTVSAAARTAGKTTETIRNWYDAGEITGRRNHLGYRLIDPDSLARRLSVLGAVDAARMIGRSEQTVRSWFDHGQLDGYVTVSGRRRIYRSSLEQCLNGDKPSKPPEPAEPEPEPESDPPD
jgi:hypothetical protein